MIRATLVVLALSLSSIAFADVTVAAPAPGSLELWLLGRDGALQRVSAAGEARPAGKFDAPRALATLPGGRALVLAAGKLHSFDGKNWRALDGDYADVRALVACGDKVYVTTAGELDELELKSGKRRWLRRGKEFLRPFCGGDQLYVERGGLVDPMTGPPQAAWTVPGKKPLACAGDGSTVYVATREGPLWSFDFARGAQRDLGLGGWWSTVALTAASGKLYAVTQAGKIWEIDPARHTKTIISMSGWELTLAVAVSR